MKKILIISGHPYSESLCQSLADRYARGAREASEHVREISIHKLQFNPNLLFGYREVSKLEPDLIAAQEDIVWAEHIVFVFPNWWGGMPALMKGFFDRAFLPGFAFKYPPHSVRWEKLLAGRTADIIVTMDTPPLIYRWFLGNVGIRQLKNNILGFCGITTKKVKIFSPTKNQSPETIEKWLSTAEEMGRSAAL